jgi:hypothetical protein
MTWNYFNNNSRRIRSGRLGPLMPGTKQRVLPGEADSHPVSPMAWLAPGL